MTTLITLALTKKLKYLIKNPVNFDREFDFWHKTLIPTFSTVEEIRLLCRHNLTFQRDGRIDDKINYRPSRLSTSRPVLSRHVLHIFLHLLRIPWRLNHRFSQYRAEGNALSGPHSSGSSTHKDFAARQEAQHSNLGVEQKSNCSLVCIPQK